MLPGAIPCLSAIYEDSQRPANTPIKPMVSVIPVYGSRASLILRRLARVDPFSSHGNLGGEAMQAHWCTHTCVPIRVHPGPAP